MTTEYRDISATIFLIESAITLSEVLTSVSISMLSRKMLLCCLIFYDFVWIHLNRKRMLFFFKIYASVSTITAVYLAEPMYDYLTNMKSKHFVLLLIQCCTSTHVRISLHGSCVMTSNVQFRDNTFDILEAHLKVFSKIITEYRDYMNGVS